MYVGIHTTHIYKHINIYINIRIPGSTALSEPGLANRLLGFLLSEERG